MKQAAIFPPSFWNIKNTKVGNKKKDDESIPERINFLAPSKNKSKHRIIYFEWAIRLIWGMFCLQINKIGLTPGEMSFSASKRSGILKILHLKIRKSGSLLKKQIKINKSVFLAFVLLCFYSQMHYTHPLFQKVQSPDKKIKVYKKYPITVDFVHTLSKGNRCFYPRDNSSHTSLNLKPVCQI